MTGNDGKSVQPLSTATLSIWEAATYCLGSIIVTGLIGWFSFGRSTVTDAEMRTYVNAALDVQRVITAQSTASIDKLSDRLQEFVKEQQLYRVAQAKTNGELSALVHELKEHNRKE